MKAENGVEREDGVLTGFAMRGVAPGLEARVLAAGRAAWRAVPAKTTDIPWTELALRLAASVLVAASLYYAGTAANTMLLGPYRSPSTDELSWRTKGFGSDVPVAGRLMPARLWRLAAMEDRCRKAARLIRARLAWIAGGSDDAFVDASSRGNKEENQ